MVLWCCAKNESISVALTYMWFPPSPLLGVVTFKTKHSLIISGRLLVSLQAVNFPAYRCYSTRRTDWFNRLNARKSTVSINMRDSYNRGNDCFIRMIWPIIASTALTVNSSLARLINSSAIHAFAAFCSF